MKPQSTMTAEQEAQWMRDHEPYRGVQPPPLLWGRAREVGTPPPMHHTMTPDELRQWERRIQTEGAHPTVPIQHGTYAAAQWERGHGVPICDPCRVANSLYQRTLAARKRVKSVTKS